MLVSLLRFFVWMKSMLTNFVQESIAAEITCDNILMSNFCSSDVNLFVLLNFLNLVVIGLTVLTVQYDK